MSEETLQKLYQRGKEAFQHRNYDYGIEIFLELLSLAPDHIDARRALRICEIKKSEEIGNPSRLRTWLLTAWTAIRVFVHRSPEAAIRICEAHLAKDPRNARISIALADALLSTRHADAATAELEMAREVHPNNVKLLMLLGRAYVVKGKVPEARACLGRAAQLAPGTPRLVKALNDLEAVSSMQRSAEAESGQGAVKVADQSAHYEREERKDRTQAEMADSAQELDRQIASADTERNRIKFLKKKGELLEEAGNLDAAPAAYQAALDIDPSDSILRDKIENIRIRKMDDALRAAEHPAGGAPPNEARVKQLRAEKLKFETAAWERRVKDRPTDVSAHFEYGKRLYLMAAVDKAIAEFQMTVKDPRHKVDSHLYLGLAFRHKQLYDLSATQFSRALDSGDAGADRELSLRYELARTLERVSAPKALDQYKRILQVSINYRDVSERVTTLEKAAVDTAAEAAGESPPDIPS
jgi:tetratricopeptide (TPR) repeat protein